MTVPLARPGDPLPHARETGAAPPDEPPPLGGSWGALYGLVVAELVLVILLCGWLTVRTP